MNKDQLEQLTKEELIQKLLELDAAMSAAGQFDFKQLVDTASDIIFILDRKGNLVYKNNSGDELISFMPQGMLGLHYTKCIPEDEVERASIVFESVMEEGKEFHNEMMKTHDPDGNTVYLIANFSPMRSHEGEIIGMTGILRNITEIHLMEKKLKENTRRLEKHIKDELDQGEEFRRMQKTYANIINNAPIGIFTIDPSGIILTENPAFKKIIGIKPNETRVGFNVSKYKGFIDSGLQRLMDEAVITKKPVSRNNIQYMPVSGERLLTVNGRMNPIINKNNEVMAILVMMEDVTDQQAITTKMQRAEKLSALGLFAEGVAYELKVPINLMTIDLNFLEKNIPEDNPMHDYIKSIKLETERIRNITEQIINLAKPDDKDLELFEISQIITNQTIQITLNRLEKEGIKVNTVYPDNDVKIKAIKQQLIQVMLHLISNAGDAMPEGGTLTIKIETVKKDEINFVSVIVQDSGIGIPEKNLPKIFQPFFSTKDKKSTGLGLSVIYTIIENLGGVMGIRSRPGEGTIIKILLPAAAEEKSA